MEGEANDQYDAVLELGQIGPDASGSASGLASEPASAPPLARYRKRVMAVLAALVAVVVAVGIWQWTTPLPPLRAELLSVRPPAQSEPVDPATLPQGAPLSLVVPHLRGSFAYGVDLVTASGERKLFQAPTRPWDLTRTRDGLIAAGTTDDATQIVYVPNAGEPIPLWPRPGDEGTRQAEVSPDGRQVLLTAFIGDSNAVLTPGYLIDLSRPTQREVVYDPSNYPSYNQANYLEDGRILVRDTQGTRALVLDGEDSTEVRLPAEVAGSIMNRVTGFRDLLLTDPGQNGQWVLDTQRWKLTPISGSTLFMLRGQLRVLWQPGGAEDTTFPRLARLDPTTGEATWIPTPKGSVIGTHLESNDSTIFVLATPSSSSSSSAGTRTVVRCRWSTGACERSSDPQNIIITAESSAQDMSFVTAH